MAIGISIGTSLGVLVFDNIVIGISLGLAMGVAVGAEKAAEAKKKDLRYNAVEKSIFISRLQGEAVDSKYKGWGLSNVFQQ